MERRLEDFVSRADRHPMKRASEWVEFQGFKVYLRCDKTALTLAVIEVHGMYRGRGMCTDFLTKWEALAARLGRRVVVECVHAENLREMLRKRGYVQTGDNWELSKN